MHTYMYTLIALLQKHVMDEDEGGHPGMRDGVATGTLVAAPVGLV